MTSTVSPDPRPRDFTTARSTPRLASGRPPDTVTGMTGWERDAQPVAGNAAAGLGDLLAGLGIQRLEVRQTLEDDVQSYLDERGLRAEVDGVRWGRLTLSADPQVATLLRLERDQLLSVLSDEHPGVVTQVSIHVRR